MGLQIARERAANELAERRRGAYAILQQAAVERPPRQQLTNGEVPEACLLAAALIDSGREADAKKVLIKVLSVAPGHLAAAKLMAKLLVDEDAPKRRPLPARHVPAARDEALVPNVGLLGLGERGAPEAGIPRRGGGKLRVQAGPVGKEELDAQVAERNRDRLAKQAAMDASRQREAQAGREALAAEKDEKADAKEKARRLRREQLEELGARRNADLAAREAARQQDKASVAQRGMGGIFCGEGERKVSERTRRKR